MPADEHVYDVLIVGGGPAGMAAASTAADAGLDTVLIDERPTLGGQVYKQPGPGMRVTDPREMGRQYRAGRALIDEVEASSAAVRLRTSVVDLEPDVHGWIAMVHTEGDPVESVRARRVIVAAGAHDRPVVFPGWTLPGVMTAGGLQTLAKTQAFIPGQRTVFAGSGPVALAFPAQLAGYGANIVTALEAGPAPSPVDLAKIALAAPGNVGLLMDAAKYQSSLIAHRIPLRYGRMVVRAAGVEGSAVAADEGRIAAFAVAQDAGLRAPEATAAAARPLARRVARRRALTKATQRMYGVGDGVFRLADAETTVCRCEGVAQAEVRAAVETAPDVSAVKALTRAGMGPCQGRMCGRHIAAMIAEQSGVSVADVAPATPRMPVRPVGIGSIADADVVDP